MTKKNAATVEVTVVLALFLYLRQLLKSTGFGDWQDSIFGAALASSCLLFFVLPLIFVLVSGRNPGSTGLTTENLAYHRRVALRAIGFVLPVTALFPLIGLLGSNHKQWLGASMLSTGFVIAGLLFATRSRDLASTNPSELSWKGLSGYVALLLVGLVIIYLVHPYSALAARLVAVLIFVGFLEEFFFRGYIQGRLNDSFSKPFRIGNVDFGLGLILSAAVFGLFHPLTVAGETPWAWGLWTATGGLVFGFLREKTGAAITPALLHGAILIPGVFLALQGNNRRLRQWDKL